MAPTVTAVSPNAGSTLGGLTVYVSGTGFSVSPPSVAFGAYAGSNVVVFNDTTLSVVSPISYSGPGVVNVVVTTTAGSSPVTMADQFTYSYPAGNGVDYTSTNPYMDLFANYYQYGQWYFALSPIFSAGISSPAVVTASLTVSGGSSLAGITDASIAAGAVAASAGAYTVNGKLPAGWSWLAINNTTGVVAAYTPS